MKKQIEQLETIDPEKDQAGVIEKPRACLTIAYHPDTSRVGERLFLFGPRGNSPVALSRTGPDFCDSDQKKTGPLASLNLSRKPLRISPTKDGGVILGPEPGGSLLTVDGELVDSRRTFSLAEVQAGIVLTLARRVVLVLHTTSEIARCPQRLGLVGSNSKMERLRNLILQVSDQTAPVLLLGESGVGKELVARAIHESGPRKQRPFVCVNLAAVPSSVAASELFGHVSGAFTGASSDHRGYFEQADEGTLFLDEVGAAESQLQSVLLRVLETGEFQPLGSRSTKKVDVRVIAATDANLEKAVAEGGFRAPLYHRLASFLVKVPALRERKDDIGRLLIHFLKLELTAAKAGQRLQEPSQGRAPWLPAGLVSELIDYSWPGNVRELYNLVRRMVTSYHHLDEVDPERVLDDDMLAVVRLEPYKLPSAGTISDEDLVAAMRANRWRVGATAKWLGIARNTLYALIESSPNVRLAKDLSKDEIMSCKDACAGDFEAMIEILQVSIRALKLRMRQLEII